MADKKNISIDIEDALIEKPHRFTIEAKGIGERHFYLFPTTLGKLHLIRRMLEKLDVNTKLLATNPYMESLRLATEKKKECCTLLAFYTFKKKRDIFDVEQMIGRVTFFEDNLTTEELAGILLVVLTKDDVSAYKDYLGITKENERLRQLSEYKKRVQSSQNEYNFGCKSIYGTLIDTACERYGWTLDYVLWGISYVNLQLLLADRIQSVFVSDEEKKKIPARLLGDGETIKADDKAGRDKIKATNWR